MYTYFDAMNHYIYDSDISDTDSLPNELTLNEYEAIRRQTTPTEPDTQDDTVEIYLSSINKKKNIFIIIISSLYMCFKRKLQSPKTLFSRFLIHHPSTKSRKWM